MYIYIYIYTCTPYSRGACAYSALEGYERAVDIRLPGKGNSNSHGARPVHKNHLDDQVDSDQQVVNNELSLSLPYGTSV